MIVGKVDLDRLGPGQARRALATAPGPARAARSAGRSAASMRGDVPAVPASLRGRVGGAIQGRATSPRQRPIPSSVDQALRAAGPAATLGGSSRCGIQPRSTRITRPSSSRSGVISLAAGLAVVADSRRRRPHRADSCRCARQPPEVQSAERRRRQRHCRRGELRLRMRDQVFLPRQPLQLPGAQADQARRAPNSVAKVGQRRGRKRRPASAGVELMPAMLVLKRNQDALERAHQDQAEQHRQRQPDQQVQPDRPAIADLHDQGRDRRR